VVDEMQFDDAFLFLEEQAFKNNKLPGMMLYAP